jgi:hypothetical protein
MTAVAILILVAATLSLAGIVSGVFAVWHTRALAGSVEDRMETTREEHESRDESLQARLDALAGRLKELERQPAVTVNPGLPRPGMNVMKRSHALRMHRRGDRPEQIASALDLPRHEVELLLKVHKIVIKNV